MLTLSVSQLNEYIKSFIDSTHVFSEICIKGEISNFTNHYKSGHFYFTLKDKDSVLRAVMFKTYADYVHFEPQNGMTVTARGRISVYARDGIYQLYCEELIPDGIGDLYLAYEQLKQKLEEKGYFDSENKKQIPEFPQKIGIITSPTGAAIQDMLNILSRRYPVCNVELFPALVQGIGAPEELISGIKHFDGKVDTIIIGRGGGSFEDLWAFNDEKLADTVFKCKTPVISAVGHETDFTICDFVSDMRAPTPSAAAEIAVPDKSELFEILYTCEALLTSAITNKLKLERNRVNFYAEKSVFLSPLNYTDELKMTLDRQSERMVSAIKNITENHSDKIDSKCVEIIKLQKYFIDKKYVQLASISEKLSALNPLSILSRGYAAVFGEENGVISSVSQISLGDVVNLRLGDGQVKTEVKSISNFKK